ncbi:MAG: phage tailspike protein, partial [Aeromonas veronii]
MSDILVTSPYRPFTLPNQFKAVFNGYIYCGTVDAADPSNSQVQVYLANEDGSRTPVAQPLRTNAGGFLVYNGQPAKFVTDSNHSLLVRDSLGNQVWYEPDMAVVDPDSFLELLASNTGASLVGTISGNSVQEDLDSRAK